MTFSPSLNELELLDFGPGFGTRGGRLSILPPLAGPSYKVLVPKPNADGIDLAGIHVVETRAPLGTATGWNTRGRWIPGGQHLRPERILHSVRQRPNRSGRRPAIPGPSLEERYANHDGYVRAVRTAVADLIRERFLLPEDGERYISEATASSAMRKSSQP